MEYDIRYLVSLLTEALAEISELNDKVHELEVRLEELSKNPRSNSLVIENSNGKAIPLTKNNFPKLDYEETELSEEIQNDIDKAVDLILQYGKNISYLNK